MPPRDIAMALVVAVLWGFNFVVMKAAVAEVPPIFLTAVRFGLAFLVGVWFVTWPRTGWRYIIGFGLIFGGIKFWLLFSAFHIGVAAGLASVVLQTQAIFTIVLARFLFGERLTATATVGLVLAVGGLSLIGAEFSGGAQFHAVLLVVAAAVAWAFANLIIKSAGQMDILAFTVWSSAVVPLPALALSFAIEGPASWAAAWSRLSLVGGAAILYLAIPISLVSGAMWNGLMARHQAGSVAPFALLVPAVGLLSAWLVYGEELSATSLIGTLLIGLGLAAIVLGPRLPEHRQPQVSTTPPDR